MSEQIFVAASEVEPGSYIPCLDMAYVFEVEDYNIFDNDGSECVTVLYHDKEGNEGYLILTPATRIEILRQ